MSNYSYTIISLENIGILLFFIGITLIIWRNLALDFKINKIIKNDFNTYRNIFLFYGSDSCSFIAKVLFFISIALLCFSIYEYNSLRTIEDIYNKDINGFDLYDIYHRKILSTEYSLYISLYLIISLSITLLWDLNIKSKLGNIIRSGLYFSKENDKENEYSNNSTVQNDNVTRIVECKYCLRKLRIRRKSEGYVSCPHCKNKFYYRSY